MTTLVRTETGALGTSLEQRLQTRQQELGAVLLVDGSESMAEAVDRGCRTTKMDALREVVREVQSAVPCRLACFQGALSGYFTLTAEVREYPTADALPAPRGSTPLAGGVAYARDQMHATRLIIVSDGQPDDEQAALDEARRFGRPIDVFYVGPRDGHGSAFLRELAAQSGGRYDATALTEPKALTSKIRGLLAPGPAQRPSAGPIILGDA